MIFAVSFPFSAKVTKGSVANAVIHIGDTLLGHCGLVGLGRLFCVLLGRFLLGHLFGSLLGRRLFLVVLAMKLAFRAVSLSKGPPS